jgi:subtilase family serine protease
MRKAMLLIAIATAASLAIAQEKPRMIVPESSIERTEDIGVRAHTHVFMYEPDPAAKPEAPPPGLTVETPGSIACIYGLVSTVAGCPVATATTLPTGGSGTIVLVDAYDDPSAKADLATFSTQWGLPAANFKVVYASGKKPANGCASGWELEEALDVQWAHAMAPKANIVLMEAASNSDADMYAAVLAAGSYIEAHGGKGEVSMSWGGSEWSTEILNDPYFISFPYVVFFASSGDSAGASYPSASPWVVSAGATQINRNSSGNYTKQVGTKNCNSGGTGCGGGTSVYEGIPSYQSGALSGSFRGTPDIASDSSSKSPVWVYDSSCYASWLEVYGTSVASPTLAGIVNRAGTFNILSTSELTEIYNNRTKVADFTDITAGSCGGASAASGYDLCTGVGVVKGYGKK